MSDLRQTGISVVGDVPWGLHFSLFYQTEADLLDALVPYFAEGLTAQELCVWAPSAPSIERAAVDGLRAVVPDLDRHLGDRSLEFFSYEDFCRSDGHLDVQLALAQWRRWEQRARDEGFAGLRASGNLSWLKEADWAICHQYEQRLNQMVVGRRMMVLCSYPLESIAASDILDSACEHSFVVARRDRRWEVLEVPELARTKEELQRLNEELEQRVSERNVRLTATNDELRREIEERRRIEAALLRSEMYLQHGQRLSQTGSFAGTLNDSHTRFWSAETYRIFGLAPRARPPGREELLGLIHRSDRPRLDELIEETVRTERPAETEFRIIRPDGVIRHVRAVCTPLRNNEGALTEFVGTLIDVTDQKRAAARLARVKRDARERMLRSRFAAMLDERARLARDIHDTLLQGVTGIALQLRATLPNLGSAPPATVDLIRRIVELADSTIRDARRAIWDIRDPALTASGLPIALETEVRRRVDGVDVRFEVQGVPRSLPVDIEETILRIAQEAVINAARHSGMSALRVSLAYKAKHVLLSVEDDGNGFLIDSDGRAHGGHWGLLGMRERADRIDAQLIIRTAESSGTTIRLRVPIAGTASRMSTVAAAGKRGTR